MGSSGPLALGPFGYRISAPTDSPFQSRRCAMAVVNPLPKENAAPELHETYEGMIKRFGKVPNIFATMAHRPNVLKKFLPFYGAVMNEGTVEARYKELAYLKTSLLNGCEY
jgi:alkylhydroperoxidase family enzyme